MSNIPDSPSDLPEGVKIFAPDDSLRVKIGNVNLDQVLSPQVVKAAQSRIEQAADEFANDSLEQLKELTQVCADIAKSPEKADSLLPLLVNAAFSLKTKTGIGGYDLVAALAKSLQLYAELLQGKPLGQKNLDIMQWHLASITVLLTGKVKGDGGTTGAAIRQELEKLSTGN
jgi:hypothetical protein